MKILTVTANPAIDKSTQTNTVMPWKKIRCQPPLYEPGGGGINVARALKKLGTDSKAMYFAGGAPGKRMKELLDKEDLDQHIIETRADTRTNLIVLDEAYHQHYRFGMPGPEIQQDEAEKMLDAIEKYASDIDYIVASGSLPGGVKDDFYASIGRIAREKNAKFILDTSKDPLKKAVEEGVFLLKPNLNELKNLMGKGKITAARMEEFTVQLVKDNKAVIVVVSLGTKGTFWADRETSGYIMSPVIEVDSAVGAGDSMVAGIVHGLINSESHREAVIYGVAAGTAATITPGTELCRKDDTDDIAGWIRQNHRSK
jgi:6-phosphofructokinase 2